MYSSGMSVGDVVLQLVDDELLFADRFLDEIADRYDADLLCSSSSTGGWRKCPFVISAMHSCTVFAGGHVHHCLSVMIRNGGFLGGAAHQDYLARIVALKDADQLSPSARARHLTLLSAITCRAWNTVSFGKRRQRLRLSGQKLLERFHLVSPVVRGRAPSKCGVRAGLALPSVAGNKQKWRPAGRHFIGMIADQRRPAAYSATAFICWSDSLAAIMRIIFSGSLPRSPARNSSAGFGVLAYWPASAGYWATGGAGRAVAACTGGNALLEIAHAPQLLSSAISFSSLATAGVSFCWLK